MPPPNPDRLCTTCRTLTKDLLTRDIPWEDEPGIPHHPSLLLLGESSQSCALCYQIWLAAGRSLGNRGGMVTYMPQRKIGDVDVTIQTASSNFGPGGLFRAMSNGAMVSHDPRDVRPDLEGEFQWVHPATLVSEPEKVGVYLYGNWYQSPYAGQEERLMLIGLGVRLGTSPEIGDAIGNKKDEWFLGGSYLRFRTQWNSSVAHCIPGRIRNWDLSSKRALGQVKEWLEICDKHHQCLKSAPIAPIAPIAASEPELPTRVLFLDSASEKVNLVESQGRKGRYIALSHSRGNSHHLTLTKANLETLKSGIIHIGKIPHAFIDAVKICRALQISYLWIDSLCIIQDDPSDRENETSKMASVYMNTYLTISALHSTDDAGGCFPTLARRSTESPFPFVSPDVTCTGRPAKANAVPLVIPKEIIGAKVDNYNHAVVFSIHGEGEGIYYITNEWMPPSIDARKKRYGTFNFGLNFDPLKAEPRSERAWTLQERILSPRTLCYGQGQMYWECQTIVLGEDGSMIQRVFPQIKTITESRQYAVQLASKTVEVRPQYVADEWLRLVEMYSSKKLTVDDDKLVAISGIAGILAENSGGDVYYAGLWKSNLMNGLCWKRKVFVPHHQCSDEEHEHSLPAAKVSHLTAPATYRAPSWSWAAVEGEIEFQNTWLSRGSSGHGKDIIVEKMSASVMPLGDYEFGRVKSGFVTCYTVIGDLERADVPTPKAPGQLVDADHIAATLSPIQGNRPATQRAQEKSDKEGTESKRGSITRLFSGLKVSSGSATVPCKILFDLEPEFPCVAAFMTKTFALVLVCTKGNMYKRVGVVEFGGKDVDEFLTGRGLHEVIIL